MKSLLFLLSVAICFLQTEALRAEGLRDFSDYGVDVVRDLSIRLDFLKSEIYDCRSEAFDFVPEIVKGKVEHKVLFSSFSLREGDVVSSGKDGMEQDSSLFPFRRLPEKKENIPGKTEFFFKNHEDDFCSLKFFMGKRKIPGVLIDWDDDITDEPPYDRDGMNFSEQYADKARFPKIFGTSHGHSFRRHGLSRLLHIKIHLF